MADIERVADHFTNGLRVTLTKLSSLVLGLAILATFVGVATYATGLGALHGSHRSTWAALGAALCAIPIAAGGFAWSLVRRTASRSPRLVGEVRTLLGESNENVILVIDHDGAQPVVTSARSLMGLRNALTDRANSYPALTATLRAVTRAPGLAAIAILSTFVVGAVGSILLIAWVVG